MPAKNVLLGCMLVTALALMCQVSHAKEPRFVYKLSDGSYTDDPLVALNGNDGTGRTNGWCADIFNDPNGYWKGQEEIHNGSLTAKNFRCEYTQTVPDDWPLQYMLGPQGTVWFNYHFDYCSASIGCFYDPFGAGGAPTGSVFRAGPVAEEESQADACPCDSNALGGQKKSEDIDAAVVDYARGRLLYSQPLIKSDLAGGLMSLSLHSFSKPKRINDSVFFSPGRFKNDFESSMKPVTEGNNNYWYVRLGNGESYKFDAAYNLIAPQAGGTLKSVSGGYEFTRPSGVVEIFNAYGVMKGRRLPTSERVNVQFSEIISGNHRTYKQTITDPATSKKITVNYEIRVAGRTGYEVDYLVWQISSIEDIDGKTYAFDYSNPTKDVITLPDSEGTIQFQFNDNDHPSLLTDVVGADSNPIIHAVYDNYGRVLTVAEGGGIKQETLAYNWDYGTNGATTSPTTTVTNAAGLVTTYSFYAEGGASQAISFKPTATTISASPSGKFPQATEQKTYDASGFLDTVTDMNGNVTNYTFAGNANRGLPDAVTYAEGTANAINVSYSWNATNPVPNQVTFPKTTVDYVWDSNKKLATETMTDTSSAGACFSPSAARVVDYSYSYYNNNPANALLLMEVDGALAGTGDKVTYTYNANGNGNLISKTVGSLVTQYQNYDDKGRPQKIIDPNSVEYAITYTPTKGMVDTVTISDPDGTMSNVAIDYDYYANGLLKKVTKNSLVVSEYFYDNAKQIIGTKNQYGEYIEITPSTIANNWQKYKIWKSYSAFQNNDTSQLFLYKKRTLDELGRTHAEHDMSSVGEPLMTTYSYDGNNNVKQVNSLPVSGTGGTRTTDMEYNPLNLPSRLIPALGGANDTVYGYDAQGYLESVTDPRNLVTNYYRDGYGQVKCMTSPDTGTTTFAYDAAGNVLSKTLAYSTADEQQVLYGRDGLGRLTSVDYPSTGQDVLYTYDLNDALHGKGLGRLTRINDATGQTDFKYDGLGRVVTKTESLTGGLTQVTEYNYAATGELNWIQYPSGQKITINRDAQRRTIGLQDNTASVSFISDISHTPLGSVSGWHTDSNNLVNQYQRTYDINGRINSLALTATGESASTPLEVTYSAYGEIASLIDVNTSSRTETYGYDALSRLTHVSADYGDITYSYDGTGNRTERVVNRFDPATQAMVQAYKDVYTVSPTSNRIDRIDRTKTSSGNTIPLRSREFVYDARGNVKEDKRQQYSGPLKIYGLDYNEANRLHHISAP